MNELAAKNKCANLSGFTLIELNIVLIIMSFLFAVAGPRIHQERGDMQLFSALGMW